jgi:ABC-type nickel/cobalt efflux system permease component RcnA
MSRRQLLALGFAGGLVPTPSAVIVLLGATAIGRAWFGVALVVAYGLGLAATLLAAGVLLSIARRHFELKTTSERILKAAAVLPIGTAVLVTAGGLLLVVRAALEV